jgi:hypothetical protein
MLRETASFGLAAGTNALDTVGSGLPSMAPAFSSSWVTGELPCRFAYVSAVSPAGFLALMSTPRAIRFLTTSTGNAPEEAASMRMVRPSGSRALMSAPASSSIVVASDGPIGGLPTNIVSV